MNASLDRNEKVSILAICGSERPGGNSDETVSFMKKIAVERGAQFDAVYLRDCGLAPCGRCGDCNWRTMPCELGDGAKQVIDKMIQADCLVYVVPVHGFGMAHLMQIFIERAGVCFLRFNSPLANKVGGAVVVGRRYSHTEVYSQILLNLLLNRMILVGSGYPAVVHAGKAGESALDTEGTDSVRRMLERMIDMSILLKQTATSPFVPNDNERSLGGARVD